MNGKYILIAVYFIVLLIWSMMPTQARADNWFVEVGAGYQFITPFTDRLPDEYKWKGDNPTAILAVGREFDNGVTVQYQHVSNWINGFPLDRNEPESVIDHVVVSYKWRWPR